MKILEFIPVETMPDKPSLGPVLIDNSRGKTLFEMAAASTEAVNTLKTQNAKIITLMGTIVKAIDELKDEVKRSQQR